MKKPACSGLLSLAALAAGLLVAALPAAAHRAFMVPSSTVMSGTEPWVTIDAASASDVFVFDHNALQVDRVGVINPDGTAGRIENAAKLRYRSVFDVKLSQKGTYKIALVNDGMMASYKVGNETRRARGTAESLARDIPADATDLRVTQSQSRNEVFVTSGKPTTPALAPSGRGLELVPVTHPNDLVAGEKARLRFTLDGQPAAGAQIVVIRGGIRYRDKLDELRLVADAQGEVSVPFGLPGLYWLNAVPAGQRVVDDGAGGGMAPPAGGGGGVIGAGAGAGAGAPRGPAGTLAQPVRRSSYTATLEVLPQ
jgi:uncharacterized GH25 family protein